MSTLIPTAYMIQFGGLPGTVVEILMDGDGWSAHTDCDLHLVHRAVRRGRPPEFFWEDDDWNDPHIFETPQEAADTAEHTC